MSSERKDRDGLREEWRLKAHEWSAAECRAAELEEGRKILIAEMVIRLVDAGMPVTKAENAARASDEFKRYVRQMHDARRVAQDLRIAERNADRLYWEATAAEAQQRAEMRMTR